MPLLILQFLILLPFAAVAAGAGKCGRALEGKRPDRRSINRGALLRLKPELKRVTSTPEQFIGNEPANEIYAYAPDVPLFATQRYPLTPGAEFRAAGPVRSRETRTIEVELLPGGERAVMYWIDVYTNARVIEAGEPRPNQVKKPAIKFPNAWQRHDEEKLWAEGQTAFGRPKANVGQTVWTANHSRIMGRGSVGRLDSVDEQGFAKVKTLDGRTKLEHHRHCIPLTKDEMGQFQ